MIKLQVLGNCGADATINNVNGKQVINFNVCHTEKYKDQNGVENNKSTWVSCSYWTDKIGVAQYIKKGGQIFVEGVPTSDTYVKDNKTFAQIRLRVTNIQLIGGNAIQKQETPQPQQSNGNSEAFNQFEQSTKEDLPF